MGNHLLKKYNVSEKVVGLDDLYVYKISSVYGLESRRVGLIKY
jgi:hypothetical protein